MNWTIKTPAGFRLTMLPSGISSGAEMQSEELRKRGRWENLQIDPAYFVRKKQSWYTKRVKQTNQ